MGSPSRLLFAYGLGGDPMKSSGGDWEGGGGGGGGVEIASPPNADLLDLRNSLPQVRQRAWASARKRTELPSALSPAIAEWNLHSQRQCIFERRGS